MSKPRVSLNMIVRDEEANLAACITPVRHLFDELVVVDTGSMDRTREMGRQLGATVYDAPWCDDFSAARNEALRRSTGDWIFWLDADDRIEPANVARLRGLIGQLSGACNCYVLTTRSNGAMGSGGPTLISHARLFPRLPEVTWRGRVHEQIVPALERAGCAPLFHGTCIDHLGYADHAVLQSKLRRDLRLLRMEYAVSPDDPVVLYHLGIAHFRLGEFASSRTHLLHALGGVGARVADWMRTLYDALALASRYQGDVPGAMAVLEQGLARFPHDAQLLLQSAELCLECDQFSQAEQYYWRLSYGQEEPYLMFHASEHVRRLDGRRGLARTYMFLRRYELAERLFHEVLSEFPDDLCGWVWLAYLYLAMTDRRRFVATLEKIRSLARGEIYAAVLDAEWHRKDGDFVHALGLVEAALSLAPTLAWAREIRAEIMTSSGVSARELLAAWEDALQVAPQSVRAQQMIAQISAAPAPPPAFVHREFAAVALSAH